MLFADIVGSTQLAAGLDPEQLRGKLAPFFDVVRRVVAEHGGTIEKFIGDAVMAAFGVPRAHGDDPDRAIAAGLALVERVAELGFEIRVGIESGEVLALDAGGDLSITGEAVNAAARLEAAATPGEVLVGARAARSVLRARLDGPRFVEAKGFPAPLDVWRATGVLDQPVVTATPFLGRGDDLELLQLVYRRAVRERVPELVTIAGEAGIGKTRLASELFDSLRTSEPVPTVLVGRNPPYGRGIAFWALGEILRGVAGAGPDDSAEEVHSALESRLTELGAEDAEAVASGLAIAIGGAEEGGDVEDLVKRSWRRLVALLAVEGPLVIGIDDAHWADDGLLDLIEETAFRLADAPVLLLCTSRPELLERRPGFGRAARNVTQMELRPLDRDAITALATALLDGEGDGMAVAVAEASGGNPFFAEEVACRFADERGGNGGARGNGHEIPETVQAAIAARLDLLPAVEKRTVQHAAVLGHAFLSTALADLEEEPVDAVLAELVRKALLHERVAEGGGRFAFRHHLIRDVAYASMPRGQRAGLHERAADGISDRAGTRYPELAELVAYHRVEASRLAPTEDRERLAWQASVDAADVLGRRGASARAQELYEQAADLAPGDAERFAALRGAGNIALRRFRGDEALRLVRREATIAEEAGQDAVAAAAYARAVEIGARMGGITGDLPEEELTLMLEKAERLADPDDVVTQAALRLDRAWIAWCMGGEDLMEEPAREGLELARKAGNAQVLSGALDAFAAVAWAKADYLEAVAVSRERQEILEATETSPAIEVERSDARHMVINSLLQIGYLREAAEVAALAREADLSLGVVYSGWARGLLPAYFLGEWDEVLEMAKRVRDAWDVDRPPVSTLATDLATAAAVYEARGDSTRAADWWAFARSLLPSKRKQSQDHGIRMLQADVSLHRGWVEEAAELVELPVTGWSWWGGHYAAVRAEAFVRAGHPDRDEAMALARERVGDSPFIEAILRRATVAAGQPDDGGLEEALRQFEACEARFQAARTAWQLGGEHRERAARTFAQLHALEPVEKS
jgi:class 3 adenylate cyclase